MAQFGTITRYLLAIALLVVGVIVWTGPGFVDIGRSPQVVAWLSALSLACIPPVNRWFAQRLDALRMVTPQTRLWMAIVLGVACGIYFVADTIWQQRAFVSIWHDDCAYEIQARMLAQFRLWMPQHACADSFDVPAIFVRPVYAPMYFPGNALLLVPMIWLHLPVVIVPFFSAAAIGALLSLIVGKLIDPRAAAIAPLLWISSGQVRLLANSPNAHLPLVLMALAAFWTWQRFKDRPHQRVQSAALLGILGGWAAITRPLDCVCLIGPILLAATWLTIRNETRRRTVSISFAVVLGALPFVALQLVQNRGITGNWLRTPHGLYDAQQYPAATFGFHPASSNGRPATIVPQNLDLYEQFVMPQARMHTLGAQWNVFWLMRMRSFLSELLPHPALIVLLLLGVTGVSSLPRAVFAVALPLQFIGLIFLPYFLPYYLVVIWPAAIILILLGVRQAGTLVPFMGTAIETGLTLLVIALAIGSLPEFDSSIHDGADATHLLTINHTLGTLPKTPALVLFKYTPAASFYEEPVYNSDVAWPDDAAVVRAHDLSPALNANLLNYYARNQPWRWVYAYDRPTDSLHLLGNVRDIASRGNGS